MKNNSSLNKFEKKIYSQFGEDGIVQEIIKRIGEKNLDKWCVEFGAKDGISDSNTYNLIKNLDYNAVLIEGDKKFFNELKRNIKSDKVVKLNKLVSFEGSNKLENILQDTKIPKNFDFLSIDIDGCDYHIFEQLELFTPKIICIEFNHMIPNEVEFVQSKNFALKQGSSPKSLVNLAKLKNYHLVANTLTNLFFVHESIKDFVLEENINLEIIRNDENVKNLIFSGYDGTLFTTKPVEISWHKIKVENKNLQILPKYLRKFPGDYNLVDKVIFYIFREFLFPGRFLRKLFKKKN